MACPVCDHTVQRVNEGCSPVVFWCPRCGTILMERNREAGVATVDRQAPKLVGIAKSLTARLHNQMLDTSSFDDLKPALLEACCTPDQRRMLAAISRDERFLKGRDDGQVLGQE